MFGSGAGKKIFAPELEPKRAKITAQFIGHIFLLNFAKYFFNNFFEHSKNHKI